MWTPDDLAADVPCFRIPGHVIANFESVFQKDPPLARLVGQRSNRVWNETWTVVERCLAGFTASNQNCNHGPKGQQFRLMRSREIELRFDPEEHPSGRWHGYELYHGPQRRA